MQQRFPNVRSAAIDERDARALSPAEAFAQLGRQLQSGGAPADDHDVMGGVVHNPLALS
jgi:hypothetical protein